MHPLVTVTQPGTAATALAASAGCASGATWERISNPSSSPSHSQMSRNSSRKSNNSILVSNGKLEGSIQFRRPQPLRSEWVIQS